MYKVEKEEIKYEERQESKVNLCKIQWRMI